MIMGTRIRTVTPGEVMPRLSLTVSAQAKSVALSGTPLGAERTPVFWLKLNQSGKPVQAPPLAAPGSTENCIAGIDVGEMLPAAENCKLYGGAPPLIN